MQSFETNMFLQTVLKLWRCRREADALQHFHASNNTHWAWCVSGLYFPSMLMYDKVMWYFVQRWMDSLWRTRNLQGGRWRGMGRKFCPLSQWGGPSSPFVYDAQSLGDSPLLSFSCFEHREGLHRFWTWLELVANESGRNILIAAHNGSGFDFPVLQVPLLALILLS